MICAWPAPLTRSLPPPAARAAASMVACTSMAANVSPLLNVMISAARKAGRSLARDLGEVENLQVSTTVCTTNAQNVTSCGTLTENAKKATMQGLELEGKFRPVNDGVIDFAGWQNGYGNVVQINPGPVVTTFEFKPDAGVKIARITTLSEDLCLGLQAESILIERIPGKPTVGIGDGGREIGVRVERGMGAGHGVVRAGQHGLECTAPNDASADPYFRPCCHGYPGPNLNTHRHNPGRAVRTDQQNQHQRERAVRG